MKQPMLQRIQAWTLTHDLGNILYDLAAPITANICLFPFIFVDHVREWIGQRVILVMVMMHLAFYPGGNTLGAHLELVFLGLLCATAWNALTFLIVCCQVWIEDGKPIYSSSKTRGLGATYIFVSFFLASIVWSRIPRLRPAIRVGMFTQTWAVTGSIPAITSRNFTDIFYPLLVSAAVSALANLLFPRTAHGIYFRALSGALKSLCESVDTVMNDFDQGLQNWFFVSDHRDATTSLNFLQQSSKFVDQQHHLEKQTRAIRGAVAAAQHEISWCRVHVNETAQFTTYLTNVLTWMKSGFGMTLPNVDFEDYLFNTSEIQDDEAQGPTSFPLSPQGTSKSAFREWKKDHADVYVAKMSLVSLEEALRDSISMLLVMVNLIAGATHVPKREAGNQFAKLMDAETTTTGKRADAWQFVQDVLSKLDTAMDESKAGLQRLMQSRGFHESVSHLDTNTGSDQLVTPLPSAAVTPVGHPEPQEQFRAPSLFTPEMYVLAQFSISLLQLAEQTKNVWKLSQNTVSLLLERCKPSLHFPGINFWRWINSSSGIGLFQASLFTDTFIPSFFLQSKRYDGEGYEDREDDETEVTSDMPDIFEDTNPHSQYKYYITNVTKASTQTHNRDAGTWIERRIKAVISSISRSPSVLRARVWLAIWLQKLKNSHHIHFALKLAGGVTIFCTIAFLQPFPDEWWVRENGQWLIVSYIWCLEASTGDSVRISICRLIGTILGAVCGLIAFEISRMNVYALSVLIVCFEIPASLLRLRFKYPPVGSVMGLTTPIVAIIPYLQREWTSAGHVALVRGYMIILGILAALVVNIVFWPYHARSRLMRKLAHTTTLLQGFYVNMSRQMFYGGFQPSTDTAMRFQRLETDIRRQLTQCDALKAVMTSEIGLVPKPVAVMDRIYQRLQMIFVLFVVLRMSRELHHIHSQHEVLSGVLAQRQELVSTVMLDLWMIGQSMNSRSRMPQFIPSTRRAVDELNAAIALTYHEVLGDENASFSQQKRLYDGPELRQRVATGLSAITDSALRKNSRTYTGTLYVLAEHSILSQVALSIEVLLHLLRYMLGELRLVQ